MPSEKAFYPSLDIEAWVGMGKKGWEMSFIPLPGFFTHLSSTPGFN